MPVIAHTAESFRDYYDHLDESATRSWVGSYPRLASPDAAASYGRIGPGEWGYAGAGVRLSAFEWPAEGVRIRGQIRFIGEWVGEREGGYLGVFLQSPSLGGWIHDWNLSGPGGPGDTEIFATVDPADPSWARFDFVADWVDGAAEAASAGDLWVSVVGALSPPEGFDVSWIQAGDDGHRPLRWRQRDDGLGVSGVKAARHVTSFQSRGGRGYL